MTSGHERVNLTSGHERVNLISGHERINLTSGHERVNLTSGTKRVNLQKMFIEFNVLSKKCGDYLNRSIIILVAGLFSLRQTGRFNLHQWFTKTM